MDITTSTNAESLQAVNISVNIAGSSKKLSRGKKQSRVVYKSNLFMTFHESNTRQINVALILTSKATEKQKKKSEQMTQLYFCTSRCFSGSWLRERKGSAHNLSTRSVEHEKRQKIPGLQTNHEVRIRFQTFSKLFHSK